MGNRTSKQHIERNGISSLITTMPALVDVEGKKFGRLLVLERAQNIENNRNSRWKCLCDCGNVVIVFGRNLINKNTKSCGCYNREMHSALFRKEIGKSAFNKMLDSYKRGAISRGLSFELTEDEFRGLIDGKCYYCGIEPFTIRKNRKDKYVANGIDRVDSSKGYEINNTVSCCCICNSAKRTMSKKDFYDWVKRIYNNLYGKENI